MQWDSTSSTWKSTTVTTLNPLGELDTKVNTYHVTCQTNQLGDLRLVEGDEIITTTQAPTTTAVITQGDTTVNEGGGKKTNKCNVSTHI